jgi:hypothetical protein
VAPPLRASSDDDVRARTAAATAVAQAATVTAPAAATTDISTGVGGEWILCCSLLSFACVRAAASVHVGRDACARVLYIAVS